MGFIINIIWCIIIKSIKVIHQPNKKKKATHDYISINAEKSIWQNSYLFMIKISQQTKNRKLLQTDRGDLLKNP